MRTFITFMWIFLFLLTGYILLGVFWIIGKLAPKTADICQLRIVQFILKMAGVFAGVDATYLGEENVPKDEAVLYVANHRSMVDIVMTYPKCPGLTGFIAKDSINKVPALRGWMKRLHCEFINRDDVKEGMKTILSAIGKVKKGISIFIFPEGTRNRDKEDTTSIGTFKDGSFKIAQKTGCKIIPVAISGTNHIFEDHAPWIKKGKVVIEYGTPITYQELSEEDQKHVGAYFQNQIQGMLKEHAKLL